MPNKYNEDKETRLARWLSGELSDKEKTEWAEQEDFEDYEKIISAADKLSLPTFDRKKNLALIKQKTSEPKGKVVKIRSRVLGIAAVAASLLLLVGYFVFNPFGNAIQTYETLAGDQKVIDLPDGSSVSMNHVSELSYKPRDWSGNRAVTLQGEAFFQVKKGSSFVVETNNGTVAVLGTSFNVFAREDAFQVECHTGKVRVTHGGESVELTKGQQVELLPDKQLEKREFVSSGSSDWERGVSQFESTPLRLVLKELEYRFEVRVDVGDIDLGSPFTGAFLHKDLETALKMVCEPMGLDYTVEGASVSLTEKN